MSIALASSAPDPDASDERRHGLRALSILRVARVVWGDADQLCVIRNISEGGLMLECLRPPETGQGLLIELRSDKRMHAVVRWARDGKAGVQFDREIDVEQMLREDRSPLLRRRPRPPRFVRRGTLRLIAGTETIAADIVDLAVSGASCRPEQPVRTGEPIVAVLDDVGAVNAEVRWVRGDLAGVRFEKALPWKPFQAWLDQAPRA